ELPAAIEALRRVVESEPAHEDAHTGLMRLYARTGQRHQALRQYAQLRDALRRELDAEPEPESQRLYQEIRSGLYPPRSEQSPAASAGDEAPAPRHNLPAPLTSFIGREPEVAEVGRLLATTRLLTLIGTGGCGKTRLALEVARGAGAAYADGVWLVELAALSDPRLVPGAVAGVLGIREEPDRPMIDALSAALRSRRILLLLDNCEHLLDACTHLVETLLSSCPGLRVLATSRETLGARGELRRHVPSLSVPPPGPLPPVEHLHEYGAVQLFVERARHREPGFDLSAGEDAQAVVEICRRLDGIPLAIELATSRIPVLSVRQIAARLHDALRLLTSGGRMAVPRHRTLRGVLDWSYELLSEPERNLFARLSVFAGGCTLEAAEAVGAASAAGDPDGEDVLELLSRLVDRSLVQVEAGNAAAIRYRLLESSRQYARERLEASGEADAVRRQHAAFFLALAEAAEPELTGPRQAMWMGRLVREHDNLRAALRTALNHGDAASAARLGAALWRFWWIRGHLDEGQRWLEQVLTKDGIASTMRATALHGAGVLLQEQGKLTQAQARYEESLSLRREQGDTRGIAVELNSLGVVALDRGDYQRARALIEESLVLKRDLGDRRGMANSLNNLGIVASAQGDHRRAQAMYEESLQLCRELNDGYACAVRSANLGALALDQGDVERASVLFPEATTLFRAAGDMEGIVMCLEGFAGIAWLRGQAELASRLAGAAEAASEALGVPPVPIERARNDALRAALHSVLGKEAFAASWAEGQALKLEQAITCALSPTVPAVLPDAVRRDASAKEQATALTRREREIAELIAQGLTNRQIAHQLVLSERTVDTHATNIMRKLGLRTRAQVAGWAAQQGILTER
ncbi:MAG TPA: tetratricopeptide repeat protein, partial [Herpetosiphonaceae bacterium]|nr:tetratricopeptide repeat protein [Herpetosiphonaceae bacterium]